MHRTKPNVNSITSGSMSRQIPHTGQTIVHRLALHAYEANRFERVCGDLQNDAAVQPEPVTFVAPVDDKPPLRPWRDVFRMVAEDIALPAALLAAWGLVILATWLLAPNMGQFCETVVRVFGVVP